MKLFLDRLNAVSRKVRQVLMTQKELIEELGWELRRKTRGVSEPTRLSLAKWEGLEAEAVELKRGDGKVIRELGVVEGFLWR